MVPLCVARREIGNWSRLPIAHELGKRACLSTHICVVSEIMCPRFALAHTGTRKWSQVAKYQSKRSKPRTTAEPKVFENTDQPTLEGRNMKDKLNIVIVGGGSTWCPGILKALTKDRKSVV